jgi:hypothetical protein
MPRRPELVSELRELSELSELSESPPAPGAWLARFVFAIWAENLRS